jgi:hypothetical protein
VYPKKLNKYDHGRFEFDDRVIRCFRIPVAELKDSGYRLSPHGRSYADDANKAWLRRTEPASNATASELKLAEFLRCFEPQFLDTQDKGHWLVFQSNADAGFRRQWFSVDLRGPQRSRDEIRDFLEKAGFAEIANELAGVARFLIGLHEICPPAASGQFPDFLSNPSLLHHYKVQEHKSQDSDKSTKDGKAQLKLLPHLAWYFDGDDAIELIIDPLGRSRWDRGGQGFATATPEFPTIEALIDHWIDFRKNAPSDKSRSLNHVSIDS